ncbi:chemotaxis-specific protein-glutamate methyltransferase CheB [Vulgatibacter sp.]|uniref:chemotaxis-specific protein-glutamate methyltransferase CheB n=1 Tax=Vulgatibacter sp. TaxID=1971226 RepID=UPI00356B5002
MIRALVADDSPTARSLLAALLAADPEVEVVGEAQDGAEAVELARRHRPDVITMDIQMPHLDGFQATKRIMTEAPTPIVIVSGLDVRDVAVSLEALRAGALAILPKPGGPGSTQFEQESRHFVATVRAMARVKIVRRSREAPVATPSPPPLPIPRRAARPEVVGVVASTGGPAALHKILAALPRDFPRPVLVVQHIAIGFAEGLAHWLDGASKLDVRVAQHGTRLEPGVVHIAPDNRHLGVSHDGGAVLLSDAPPIGGFRPSGTFLFESMARSLGAASLGLVLTGMGRDGADGLRAIRQAGGTVVAQDEATSDVFGMPAAAINEGLADLVLPLPAIASQLTEIV